MAQLEKSSSSPCAASVCWRFGDILSLSSKDRICSFNWIKGSKHCFLTSFSNLNCYILSLVFLCNCYLLVSSCLSWLRGNPISHPVFLYLWYSKYHVVLAPHISGTHDASSQSKMLVGTWYKN